MPPPQEVLLQTPRFRVVRESYVDAGGATRTRDIVRHPGAVVIVPLLDDGRACLIRQFRLSVNQTLIELPAGTLEPPEPPLACAQRELVEETGFRAARIEQVHAFFLSPGILDEKMHLFLATGLTPGDPNREAGEEIDNLLVPLDEAVKMIFRGEIQDAKSIVGLLWAERIFTKK
jgi:ADP-ribose pyrophosphatase